MITTILRTGKTPHLRLCLHNNSICHTKLLSRSISLYSCMLKLLRPEHLRLRKLIHPKEMCQPITRTHFILCFPGCFIYSRKCIIRLQFAFKLACEGRTPTQAIFMYHLGYPLPYLHPSKVGHIFGGGGWGFFLGKLEGHDKLLQWA